MLLSWTLRRLGPSLVPRSSLPSHRPDYGSSELAWLGRLLGGTTATVAWRTAGKTAKPSIPAGDKVTGEFTCITESTFCGDGQDMLIAPIHNLSLTRLSWA